MLVLSAPAEEKVTLTLTEPLPAGTQLIVIPGFRKQGGVSLAFQAPESVAIEREGAKERKSRAA